MSFIERRPNEPGKPEGYEGGEVAKEAQFGADTIFRVAKNTETELQSKDELDILEKNEWQNKEGRDRDIFELQKQLVDTEKELEYLKDGAARHGYDIEEKKELVNKDPSAVTPEENAILMGMKRDWKELSEKKTELERLIKNKENFQELN